MCTRKIRGANLYESAFLEHIKIEKKEGQTNSKMLGLASLEVDFISRHEHYIEMQSVGCSRRGSANCQYHQLHISQHESPARQSVLVEEETRG